MINKGKGCFGSPFSFYNYYIQILFKKFDHFGEVARYYT